MEYVTVLGRKRRGRNGAADKRRALLRKKILLLLETTRMGWQAKEFFRFWRITASDAPVYINST